MSFYGPTWSGSRFVVAGIMRGDTPSTNDGIRFWSSPDGRTWTKSTERSWGLTAAYAFDEDGAGVAVGSLGSNAGIWNSPDGVQWTKLADQPDLFPERLESVAYGDAGYIALGGSQVFGSRDGTSWSRLPDPPFTDAWLAGIVERGGRYVVAGTVGQREGAARAVIWTSPDGRTWTEVAGIDGRSVLALAAGSAGVLVAAIPRGTVPAPSVPPPSGFGWWSPDGQAWTEVHGAGLATPSLYATPEGSPWGFISRAWDTCPYGIWMSDAMESWTCLTLGGESPSLPEGVAASESVVIWTHNRELWAADIDQ